MRILQLVLDIDQEQHRVLAVDNAVVVTQGHVHHRSGTFGSLFSTPIVNPPQSAILGMHAIKDRAIVENGAVIVAPMMYVALSYDHRIIDGKDAVLFLVDIKNQLENPHRMLLGL